MSYEALLIDENMPVIEAMKQMNAAAQKVLFVVDGRRLLAALTDGDIRRWILAQGDLQSPVKHVANYNPYYIREEDRGVAIRFMKEKLIEAVPIVDNMMWIVDVAAWHNPAWKSVKKNIGVPVIMMAGGLGSRLYPYTKILPKPLIPIGDLPISEHIINQFHRQGCETFFLVVNYKKNMIKAYYNEIEKDYEIRFIDEDEPLGTGGGLSLLKGCIHETCILTNCDILIREDFSKIITFHKEKKNKITMVCSAKSFRIPYGVVHIKDGGSIDYMEEKPDVSFFTNTGCYILEPEVIEEMEDNVMMGFPDVIERCKANDDRVGIYPISENAWLDMGQMGELENMRKQMEDTVD